MKKTTKTVRKILLLLSIMGLLIHFFVLVQIMNVSVERKSMDGTVEQVMQPMVTYTMYERAQCTVHEQAQAIAILKQKVNVTLLFIRS